MTKLKPIELDCNLGKDINGVEHRVPWKAYDVDEVDAVLAEKDAEIARLDDLVHAHNIELLRKENLIAELNDKCQMHDFFWEGCGFAKRGFKNTIAVSEAFEALEMENHRLRSDLARYRYILDKLKERP